MKKVLLVAEKQCDRVDNTANFCPDCVILFLPAKVACIAVLRSLDESLSAHPEDEFPNVSPSLWNAKLWKEGLQITSVSVKSIRMYQWIIECSSSFLRNERFSFGMLIDQLCGNWVIFHNTLQIVCLSDPKQTPFLDYWLFFTNPFFSFPCQGWSSPTAVFSATFYSKS